MKRTNWYGLILPVFSAYLAGVFWITLFSRIGTLSRHIYPPFWSYRVVLTGDTAILIQIFENILLFIPFGYFTSSLLRCSKKRIILIACGLSILIEIGQWVLWLGESEIDDVVHNTIGAWVGCWIYSCCSIKIMHVAKRTILFALILFSVLCILPITYSFCLSQKMAFYASLYDREDGTKNLLVLNGKAGTIPGTSIYVDYNDDGSLSINGKSNIRAQKQIGTVRLSPGKYSFSGLYGVETKGIVLDIETKKGDKYIRLIPDIGPGEIAIFELEEDTLVGIHIGVYQNSYGKCTAKPVLYREN